MVKRKNTLNNMSIEQYRRNPLYQAIVTDLALEGIISREKAESILGYEIPQYMKGPSGGSLEVPKAQKKAGKAQAEDEKKQLKLFKEGEN